MPEQRKALEVGFADFVAVLIVETFESIVAAHTSQEEKLSSLRAAALLTEKEFAHTGISDELLDATASQLFPDGAGGTTLLTGGPVPGKDALDELGVNFEQDDAKGGALSDAGVARMREALALYVASRQLAAVKEAEARGIPRVHVEGGTLRARLNFTAVSTAPDDSSEPTTEYSDGTKSRTRKHRIVSGDSLFALAQEHKTTVDALMKLNPKIENRHDIRVGDNLVIPERAGDLSGLQLRNQLTTWESPLQKRVLDSIRRTRLVVNTPRTPTVSGEHKPSSGSLKSSPGSPASQTEVVGQEVFGEVEIRFRTEG